MRRYPKTLFSRMPFSKILFLIGFVVLSLTANGQGLVPDNDHCQDARSMNIGEYIANLSNATATVSHPIQAPAVDPATCIQTLENDLWFSFVTEDHPYYEVTVVAQACNTPAGLQAMIIRSDDCTASNYLYRACSNKQTMDTIKMYIQNEGAGQKHLIYVDGYDGTICDFDIWLQGKDVIAPLDYRYLRYDYNLSELPSGYPNGLETGFQNNVAHISWTGSAADEVAYYVVERVPDPLGIPEDSPYLQVVGIVDPRNFAGSGEVKYSFADYLTPFTQGEEYTYRLVSVRTDGARDVSDNFSFKAELIEDFFISEVKTIANQKNVFAVIYINKKKKQDFFLKVFDVHGEVVKQTQLLNCKESDGEVTVHMEEFEPGKYVFEMGNGKEQFRRDFIVK